MLTAKNYFCMMQSGFQMAAKANQKYCDFENPQKALQSILQT